MSPIPHAPSSPASSPTAAALPPWSLAIPPAALAAWAAALWLPESLRPVLLGVALVGAVVAAVHHAEVVAHRVGEPYGSIVLALAVTIIEAALIVSLMLAGGPNAATLARDTIFAATMIVCNGIVGACLLAGGLRHGEVGFRITGTAAALAVLAVMATLTMVLPTHTVTTAGPTFSPAQLVFAGAASLTLWAAFTFVQTVRHRDYFLPPEPLDAAGAAAALGTAGPALPADGDDGHPHAPAPTNAAAWTALGLLVVALVGVVGLAKALSPSIEHAVRAAGAPASTVGVLVAMLVLAPETLAALRAARRNRLQQSLNLALGSGIASIGLTIPAVAAISLAFGLPLTLGLSPKDTVLLALTIAVSTITLGAGLATVLQGVVHLVLFAVFLFTTVVP